MPDPPMPTDCRPVLDPEAHGLAAIPGVAARADGVIFYRDDRRGLWIPLKVKVGPGGFRRVRIKVGGRVRELGVAAIILRAFAGPRPLGFEPLHFPDADPGNNRLENLRWAPRGASKVGRVLGPTLPFAGRGDDHCNAMLAEADIPEIRSLYRAGVNYYEIADRYQVHPETVRKILAGETWGHVPDPGGPIVMRRKGPSSEDCALSILTRVEAEEIRGHRAAGMPVKQIAALYQVSISTIRDIIKGRTWKMERT